MVNRLLNRFSIAVNDAINNPFRRAWYSLILVVTLVLLGWNMFSGAGDMGSFFDQMGKANFLLGPVGFVIGYYFKREST